MINTVTTKECVPATQYPSIDALLQPILQAFNQMPKTVYLTHISEPETTNIAVSITVQRSIASSYKRSSPIDMITRNFVYIFFFNP